MQKGGGKRDMVPASAAEPIRETCGLGSRNSAKPPSPAVTFQSRQLRDWQSYEELVNRCRVGT